MDGRTNDYLVSSQRGKPYSMKSSNVVQAVPNSVMRTQFVQKMAYDVVVRLVVNQFRYHRESGIRIIEDKVSKRLGSNGKVCVEVVDEMPRSASGKIRCVISEVE